MFERIFILWNQNDDSLARVKTGATTLKVEARKFLDGCFQGSDGKDLPIEEVTIIAHGSRKTFGGNTEECLNGLTAKEFVNKLTTSPCKLPATVKTLHLCGCQIGLIQPPEPSYIAQVAEELAKRPGYEKIVVRGFQFLDLKKEYKELLQFRHLDESKNMVFDYYVLTDEQNKERLKFQKEVDRQGKEIKELDKQLRLVKRQIEEVDDKSGRAILIKERKALKSQSKKRKKISPSASPTQTASSEGVSNAESDLNKVKEKIAKLDEDVERKKLMEQKEKLLNDIKAKKALMKESQKKANEAVLKSRQVLSVKNIRDELIKTDYIVPPQEAELQRKQMHAQKLMKKISRTDKDIINADEKIKTFDILIQGWRKKLVEAEANLKSDTGKSKEAADNSSPESQKVSKQRKIVAGSGQAVGTTNVEAKKESEEKKDKDLARYKKKIKQYTENKKVAVEELSKLKEKKKVLSAQLKEAQAQLSHLDRKNKDNKVAIEVRGMPSFRMKPTAPSSPSHRWQPSSSPSEKWQEKSISSSKISESQLKGMVEQMIDLLLHPEKLKSKYLDEEEDEELRRAKEISKKEISKKTTQDLEKQARALSFDCVNVDSDGSCFFHAVDDQLKVNNILIPGGSIKLREIAIQHILDNRGLYDEFIGNPDKYLGSMVKHRTWADEIIIRALSRALNLTIVIINSDGTKPIVIKRENAAGVLCLGYETYGHYQSLHPTMPLQDNREVQNLITGTQADAVPVHGQQNINTFRVAANTINTVTFNKSL